MLGIARRVPVPGMKGMEGMDCRQVGVRGTIYDLTGMMLDLP